MEMSAKVDDGGAEEEREGDCATNTGAAAAAASLSLRRSAPNLTSHCPGYRMPPNLGRCGERGDTAAGLLIEVPRSLDGAVEM